LTEHESLSLDVLPDPPQSDLLRQLAPGLWQAEGVVAFWLGGSLAAGAADRYSDVDVYLAVEPEAKGDWMEPDLEPEP
jgi:predicted nucleotidyltransferase